MPLDRLAAAVRPRPVADDPVGKLEPDSVLTLLPVQLEARWLGTRLRVRVWPDVVHNAPHDDRLSATELERARSYWLAVKEGPEKPEILRAAFAALAATVGPTRAAWIATHTDADSVWTVEPRHEDKDPFVPTCATLPDRFVLQGWLSGKLVLEVVGKDVPPTLVTGFDTTPDALASVKNAPGQPIALPKSMAWMTDFGEAISVGLGFDVDTGALTALDTLLVFGVRAADDGGKALGQLLDAHRFTRGTALVPLGTPTNHLDDEPAGLPDAATREQQVFDTLAAEAFGDDPVPDGQRLADALGVDLSIVAAVVGSGASYSDALGRAAVTVAWSVTLGGMLDDLIGADPARVDALRAFAIEHLRPDGPLPCIRTGRQPYGVLPITSLDHWVPDKTEGVDASLPALLGAARGFLAANRPSERFGGTLSDALRVLPRPASLGVEVVPASGVVGAANHFATLAATIAAYTFGQVPDTWRSTTLQRAVDAPVTPAPFDPSWDLAGACASWASLGPAALFAEVAPPSLVGRLVLHALRTEWSRFCEAVIRAVSASDAGKLVKHEMTRGPGVWVDAASQAFAGGSTLLSAETAKAVVDKVGKLDTPDASAPGAARLAEVRAAALTLGTLPNEAVHTAFVTLVDLVDHRPDAWFTAAHRARLAAVREEAVPTVLGAFGVLTELAPGLGASADHRWAPSADHAATAAILAARGGGIDVDLPARRARVAAELLDQVAAGMSPAGVLGARAERLLLGQEALHGQLVARFPRAPAGAGVDGVALAAAGPAGVADLGPAAIAVATAVHDDADALADVLLAESVHQIARGSGSVAWQPLEHLAEGVATPDAPAVLTPPVPGTTVALRVAALVPADPASAWSPSPRAAASPAAEAWVAEVLGHPGEFALPLREGGSVDGADLGMSALDAVFAEPAEWTERARLAAGDRGAELRADDADWNAFLGLCRATRAALERARSLRPSHLDLPWVEHDDSDPPEATARADAAVDGLSAVRDRLDVGAADARELAAYGLGIAGLPWTEPLPEEVRVALLASVDARLVTAATGTADERVTAVFGAPIPVGGSFAVPEAARATAGAARPPIPGHDPSDGIAWLEAAGRVRPAASALAEALARSEVHRSSVTVPRLLQVPHADDDPWVGSGFRRADGAPASGRVAVWAHAPIPVDPAEPVQGLLFDGWAERIPAPAHTSALALRTNAPNSRPPQLWLVVVPPVRGAAWTSLVVGSAVRGALELARMRVEPPHTWEGGGGEPALVLGTAPASGAFAYSFAPELP